MEVFQIVFRVGPAGSEPDRSQSSMGRHGRHPGPETQTEEQEKDASLLKVRKRESAVVLKGTPTKILQQHSVTSISGE